MTKKHNQLGMNPSTASHRLVKDVLWKLIVQTEQDVCCKCGEVMSRENFSVEHIVPWLDSEDPVGLFFDLDNISFSHLRCNVGARRKEPAKCGSRSKYAAGCRCLECKAAHAQAYREAYTPEARAARYNRSKG